MYAYHYVRNFDGIHVYIFMPFYVHVFRPRTFVIFSCNLLGMSDVINFEWEMFEKCSKMETSVLSYDKKQAPHTQEKVKRKGTAAFLYAVL